ncbi:PDR/VanB family oxidoreductase [Corynebacterium sp.]|uniref:PDR/VanB family oxidoreductase n=1 Tax=Corynebacterium sp. TaxID=1720 RepID=UPI003B3ABFC1
MSTDMTTATVAARRTLTPRVEEFTLALPDDAPVQTWTAGSHLDVHLPGSPVTRQYSLCASESPGSYVIAVDRCAEQDGGRGGSVALHRDAVVGAPVQVGEPRNHFPLTRALHYVFVAGGVGVTPMLSLAAEAERSGRPWRMLCLARTSADMPYLPELREGYGDRVSFHASSAGRLDLAVELAGLPRGTAVYACGPGTLADDVAVAVEGQPAVDVFVEQFTAPDLQDGEATSFDVTLATSGETVTVPPDASLLDTLEGTGKLLASSCREGVCGTCEVGVVSGEVDHRDNVLTPEERSENESMMVCVSRCRSGRLVLDL